MSSLVETRAQAFGGITKGKAQSQASVAKSTQKREEEYKDNVAFSREQQMNKRRYLQELDNLVEYGTAAGKKKITFYEGFTKGEVCMCFNKDSIQKILIDKDRQEVTDLLAQMDSQIKQLQTLVGDLTQKDTDYNALSLKNVELQAKINAFIQALGDQTLSTDDAETIYNRVQSFINEQAKVQQQLSECQQKLPSLNQRIQELETSLANYNTIQQELTTLQTSGTANQTRIQELEQLLNNNLIIIGKYQSLMTEDELKQIKLGQFGFDPATDINALARIVKDIRKKREILYNLDVCSQDSNKTIYECIAEQFPKYRDIVPAISKQPLNPASIEVILGGKLRDSGAEESASLEAIIENIAGITRSLQPSQVGTAPPVPPADENQMDAISAAKRKRNENQSDEQNLIDTGVFPPESVVRLNPDANYAMPLTPKLTMREMQRRLRQMKF